MIIIPRLKYWLKALELFIVQIPVSLFSLFFSLAVSIVFASNGVLFTLIFLSIFLSTSSLLFAYYCDWGKDKPKHNIKFLPSKLGFFEGFTMSCISFISNLIAFMSLNTYGTRAIGYDLGQFLTRFKQPSEVTFLFIILWLWVASQGFCTHGLRKKKHP